MAWCKNGVGGLFCTDNGWMASLIFHAWRVRWTTFVAALLAAASAVFWTLGTTSATKQPEPKPELVSSAPVSDASALARALGGGLVSAGPAASTTATQYQLLGVVAGPVGKGIALMAIGNAPPKAYRVGSTLEGGQVLQSVSTRGALLGTTQLELPQLTNP